MAKVLNMKVDCLRADLLVVARLREEVLIQDLMACPQNELLRHLLICCISFYRLCISEIFLQHQRADEAELSSRTLAGGFCPSFSRSFSYLPIPKRDK